MTLQKQHVAANVTHPEMHSLNFLYLREIRFFLIPPSGLFCDI